MSTLVPTGQAGYIPRRCGKAGGKVENSLGKPGIARWKTVWKMWITPCKGRYRVILCKQKTECSDRKRAPKVAASGETAGIPEEIKILQVFLEKYLRRPPAENQNFFRQLPSGGKAIRCVLTEDSRAAVFLNSS